MVDFKNIKERILTDDKVATAIEYLLSKVILDKKLPQLRFIYKKYKIVLGKNGLYSIYQPDGKKIANQIHYQEVAKYIIDCIKSPAKCDYIRYIEKEMFRHKEKILFFLSYYNQKNIENIDCKLDSMYDYYYKYKNCLINLLTNHNVYHL
jgi:hypothetical protein